MSDCLTNLTPNTGYEPNFYSYMNEEHTPINLPDSHRSFQCRDDTTIISTTEDPEGFPHSGAFVCIRTRISGIRFRISYDSDNEIDEAQYLHSLPKRPRLRRLHEIQKCQGLLAEDALTKLHLVQKSVVT